MVDNPAALVIAAICVLLAFLLFLSSRTKEAWWGIAGLMALAAILAVVGFFGGELEKLLDR